MMMKMAPQPMSAGGIKLMNHLLMMMAMTKHLMGLSLMTLEADRMLPTELEKEVERLMLALFWGYNVALFLLLVVQMIFAEGFRRMFLMGFLF